MLNAQAFGAAVERALGRGERPALLLVDVYAGDGLPSSPDARRTALEIAVEARLARTIRPGDVVGRLEGDHYAVLARENHGEPGASRIAGRVADRLGEPFGIGGEEIELEPRIGVGVADSGVRTAHELVDRAERSQAESFA